ncbi:hypothetical protein LQZ24_00880 [Fructobacillus sp. M1-13]|uniref:Integral membrane protein n=1 Tax=Fructobacillus papyriferae TaxID=2713171 RepID=A0ABS5QP69_9LACO|nr:hypothetical protein [Fructobacillus papyriferae]MBS9334592.1 hypothetical protein [Fructobacillus papyriferae]MCD2158581.1 hypothetical protein [Fructobacillus papyriferae]
MSNTPIRLVSLKKRHQDQTIYYDPEDGRYYQRTMPKKSGYDLALFVAFLISAVIGTVLWLGKFFFPLPQITLTNPLLWWLVLIITMILPAWFWFMAYRQGKKQGLPKEELLEFLPSSGQKTYLKGKWGFERAWIIFVLLLLPPTTLLFLILYIFKANLIDAVLLTLHGTLFLRRVQPDVWRRLKWSARKLK